MEPVVKDDMVLGRDTVGPRVVDQGNTGRVRWQRTKVDAEAGARFPTRNRLTIRKLRIQDIDRAAPNMKPGEMKRLLGLGEDVKG